MGVAKVKKVIENSIAYDAYIEKGDIIRKVDGKQIGDFLDFKYLTSNDYYVITVEKKNGDIEEIEIYNDYFETFGVEFENQLIDSPKECRNKCIFCFMDQLPPNMRDTMHFKDDDVRLSFLQGNYVTLTNLSEKDIERIIKLKISPINISVHTTDGKLRKKMLNNRFADKLLDIMKRFKEGGILMNCQIVLCKGINDKEHLIKTVYDLKNLFPNVLSVSIVPVGLTDYRDKLYKLEGFDKDSSKEVIDLITPIQEEFKKEIGTSLVYLADEFYINAKVNLPEFEHYEQFPQIENGVGLMASFEKEFYDALCEIEEKDVKCTKKTIATSFIAYDYINKFASDLSKKVNINADVVKIQNNFFGNKITVTGLLCGRDIINELKGKDLGKMLLLSDAMIKDGSDLFLDDVTIGDVEKELNVKVVLVKCDGYDFLKCLML